MNNSKMKCSKNICDIEVSDKNIIILRDKILQAGPNIKIDVDDSEYLFKVDGFYPKDPITWKYVMDLGARLGYAKNLRRFLNIKLSIDIKKELLKVKKIRKGTKRIKGIPDYIPEIEISLSHGELWEYLINQYDGDKITISSRSPKKSYTLNLNIPEYNDLIKFFENKGKIKELTSFISNVPQSGDTLKTLEDFLRTLGEIIRNEEKIKIDKGSTNVFLHRNKYKEWKDDMVKYIGAFDNPLSLNGIYANSILKKGTFLNYIFNMEPKGVGKGEFMLVYTIPNSKFSGGSEDYDVVVKDQAIYEVKEYSKNKDSIRLGTHGKLSQFEFFQHIKNSVSVAKKIWDAIKPAEIEKIVGKYNFQYWKNMTSSSNYNSFYKAIPSAVNAGELPPPRLKVIIDWHFLNHLLIEKHFNENGKYTMAILQGNNMKSKAFKIDPLSSGETKNGKSVRIKNLSNKEKIFNELGSLKYIQNPEQLIKDLENAAGSYFDKILEKSSENSLDFFFLIFRPEEIKVLTDKDFKLYTITQSAIKIIEKNKILKPISSIFDVYKDYKKIKKSGDGINDFWLFYRERNIMPDSDTS